MTATLYIAGPVLVANAFFFSRIDTNIPTLHIVVPAEAHKLVQEACAC